MVGNNAHVEPEIRLEMICPIAISKVVIAAMLAAHPYEEVAYDVYALDNIDLKTGLGMVGDLPDAMEQP